MIFGSRHERFEATDPDNLLKKDSIQLSPGLAADTISVCKLTRATQVKYILAKMAVTSNKLHPDRTALPEHLRRETVILQPDTDVTGLKKIGDEVTPASVISKAIGYCLPGWKKLSLYTTDAILNIDNYPPGNAIRPVVSMDVAGFAETRAWVALLTPNPPSL